MKKDIIDEVIKSQLKKFMEDLPCVIEAERDHLEISGRFVEDISIEVLNLFSNYVNVILVSYVFAFDESNQICVDGGLEELCRALPMDYEDDEDDDMWAINWPALVDSAHEDGKYFYLGDLAGLPFTRMPLLTSLECQNVDDLVAAIASFSSKVKQNIDYRYPEYAAQTEYFIDEITTSIQSAIENDLRNVYLAQ